MSIIPDVFDINIRLSTFCLIVAVLVLSMVLLGAYVGYEIGAATPCVDEESFEIHPMK